MSKRDAEARERWNARGHEMLEYLEQLEPNQRPMPLTAWSDIWKCKAKTFTLGAQLSDLSNKPSS
jgi:hypothetical protein